MHVLLRGCLFDPNHGLAELSDEGGDRCRCRLQDVVVGGRPTFHTTKRLEKTLFA
jgi:hypothetical protein